MADVTRRDILKTGAAGVVAGLAAAGCSQTRQTSIFAPAAAVATVSPPVIAPGEPVRTAFIGIGGRGIGLLNTYLKLKNQEVVAVCDINKENLDRAAAAVEKAQGKAPQAYGGDENAFRQVMDRKDIHAIVTATPCFEHARIMLATIAAGKHIYGEKPMALNVADANTIVAWAEANPKLVVQVGFQWMASPRFKETIARIHDGGIGTPIEGRFFRHGGGPLRGWFSRREKSGDWMLEQACHEYNVMNWAAQATPLKAYGIGRSDLYREGEPERNVTDYYAAILHYPNDLIVHYAHGWISPDGFREFAQKMIGTKAAIEIGGDRITSRSPEYKPEPFTSPKGDDTEFALQAFLDSVLEGKPVAAPVTYGRNATFTALLVRKAVYERREVTWEEMLRTC